MTIHVPKTVPEQKGDPCHSEGSEAARNLGKEFYFDVYFDQIKSIEILPPFGRQNDNFVSFRGKRRKERRGISEGPLL